MAQRPLHLSTPKEVRAALTKIVNETRAGKMTPAVANSITATCNAILNSLRLDEQERKIQELEKILESYGKKEN